MLIKLIEVFKQPGDRVKLDDIYVNGQAVVAIRPETNETMINEAVQLGISDGVKFSRLTLNEGGSSRTVTVIGSPEEVRAKLGIKNILKG